MRFKFDCFRVNDIISAYGKRHARVNVEYLESFYGKRNFKVEPSRFRSGGIKADVPMNIFTSMLVDKGLPEINAKLLAELYRNDLEDYVTYFCDDDFTPYTIYTVTRIMIKLGLKPEEVFNGHIITSFESSYMLSLRMSRLLNPHPDGSAVKGCWILLFSNNNFHFVEEGVEHDGNKSLLKFRYNHVPLMLTSEMLRQTSN